MKQMLCRLFKTSAKMQRFQRGAAMLELALVMPVMLLLLEGTIQFGTTLSALPFRMQTGFDGAYIGSGASDNSSIQAVQSRANTLFGLETQQFDSAINPFQFQKLPIDGTHYNSKMSFDSSLKTAFTVFAPLHIHQEIIVPQLVVPVPLSSYSTRANPVP